MVRTGADAHPGAGRRGFGVHDVLLDGDTEAVPHFLTALLHDPQQVPRRRLDGVGGAMSWTKPSSSRRTRTCSGSDTRNPSGTTRAISGRYSAAALIHAASRKWTYG
ncbi:hypothetical protein GCM10010293_32590 [Streptomyces griseoflavus]|nr:hypothetical protein GCM10010293_32590 [Streptomyces griseoflavus]